MIYAEFDTISGACGVGVVHEFSEDAEYYALEIIKGTGGGAGWLSAGFVVGNAMCDEAFALLSAKYKLVYQTPPRINKNSGNVFYFAIFDCEGAGVPIGFDEMERAE